jgi:hypothetical protein
LDCDRNMICVIHLNKNKVVAAILLQN